MRGCCSRRKPANLVEPLVAFSGIATEADGGEQVTGLHQKFDFEAAGVIAEGWTRSSASAPPGFELVGGHAIVIERKDASDTCQRRVLLALPALAVDLKRARWLSRRSGFAPEAAPLGHLRRSFELNNFGKVVLEFNYPLGKSLSEFIQDGSQLPAASVELLCRDLFNLITCVASAPVEIQSPGGAAPLRFCSLIHASNVFVDEQGRLQLLLPIGCLLSWAGACAGLSFLEEKGSDNFVAPELKEATLQDVKSFFTDATCLFDRAFAADAFAVAALIVQSLGQGHEEPEEILARLGQLFRDFLRRTSHHNAEFRLCGLEALDHPWMVDMRKANN